MWTSRLELGAFHSRIPHLATWDAKFRFRIFHNTTFLLLPEQGISAALLKQLEDENRRLKHLVADLSLNRVALKAVIPKKRMGPCCYS